MPNYSLVVNSKFKPMTLQEMLTPFEKYGAAYKEQEEALAQLAAGASTWGGLQNESSIDGSDKTVWRGMVDADRDKEAAAQLTKYVTDLEAQRNAIATNGLDVNSRKKMLDLKARYAREVGSIENAYKAKEEMRKAQQAAYIQSGGNVRYNQWASQDSLDNYLNGNRPEYLMFNLDSVMKESAAGAKAMSERYFNTAEGKAFGDQYLKYIETQGLSPQQAMAAMTAAVQDNPKKYPEFAKLVTDLKTKYNVGEFNATDQAAFNAAVTQGLNSGIMYKKSNQLSRNGEYLTAAERFEKEMREKSYDLSKEELNLRKQQVENENTVTLEDGSTAVKKGGSWIVTKPDGTQEVKDNKAMVTQTTQHQKPEDFTYLDFELNGDDLHIITGWGGPFHNDYFSTSDGEKLSTEEKAKLSSKHEGAWAKLKVRLQELNLNINDVDIYRDHDIFSDDAYRIVYKGDNIDGTTPQKESDGNNSGQGKKQYGDEFS